MPEITFGMMENLNGYHCAIMNYTTQEELNKFIAEYWTTLLDDKDLCWDQYHKKDTFIDEVLD